MEFIQITSKLGTQFNRRKRVYPPKDELHEAIKCLRRSAKTRRKEVSMQDEEIAALMLSNCRYCGTKPSPRNGMDRVDSKQGYSVNNCVPCCLTCNLMKHSLPVEVFLSHVARIHSHQTA